MFGGNADVEYYSRKILKNNKKCVVHSIIAYHGVMTYRRLLFLILMLSCSGACAFPEIPFCPLGGPPGWFNRMTGDHAYYRPAPRPYHLPNPSTYQPVYAPRYPAYQYPPYRLPANDTVSPGSPRQ